MGIGTHLATAALLLAAIAGAGCASASTTFPDAAPPSRVVTRRVVANVESRPASVWFWAKREWNPAETIAASPDEDRIAWVRKDAGGCRVVRDGVDEASFGPVDPGTMTFCADGSRLAYVANQAGGMRVVADGAAGRIYDVCGTPTFSPDSRRLAYRARTGGGAFCVVDGVASAARDEIVIGPAFTADGQHVVYVARTGRMLEVVRDETVLLEREYVPEIDVSADGSRVACAVGTRGGMSIVLDGVEGPVYDQVHSPTFSADGRHFAYAASRGGRFRLVVDGHEQGDFSDLRSGTVVLSADGRRTGCIVANGSQWAAVIDGREDPPHDGVMYRPAFSPDGGRVAYAVREGNTYFVVVDGVPSPIVHGSAGVPVDTSRYEGGLGWMRPVFSADGAHMAYWGNGNRWDGVVVLDGVPVPAGGDVRRAPRFVGDGRVRCILLVHPEDAPVAVVQLEVAIVEPVAVVAPDVLAPVQR